jgi:hypothetical protein
MNFKELKRRSGNDVSQLDIDVYKINGSPHFWKQKADEQKRAAEILWPHAEKDLDDILESVRNPEKEDQLPVMLFGIFFSHLGFSTECLFKGLIIKNNPNLIQNGKMSKSLVTHDLLELAQLAKFHLTRNEYIFINQAFPYMISESRYPIYKEVEPSRTSMELGGHCKEVFEGIYAKIAPQLNFIIGKSNKFIKTDI